MSTNYSAVENAEISSVSQPFDHVVERFLMDPMYNVFMLLFFAVVPQSRVPRENTDDNILLVQKECEH